MWLKNLTGFNESKEAIVKNIIVKDGVLKSKVNNKSFTRPQVPSFGMPIRATITK